ncbi:hypothetical protein IJI69_02595 [Candidatus Saccharibacteria bacterium]|nr:hypothetical protein [Candidatus Saccharibacteria bacterium]
MSRAYNEVYFGDEGNTGKKPVGKDPAAKMEQDIHDYYAAMRKFIDRIGDFAWIYKLEINCNNKVYQAEKVRYDYFGTEANMQQEKESRRLDVWAAAKSFNLAAKRVGQPRMSNADTKLLVNFLMDAGNRDYFRQRSKRYEAKFLPVSLETLYEKRKELNHKREAKRNCEGSD